MGQKDTSWPTLRSRNPPDRQLAYLSSPDESEIPVDSTSESESSHRAPRDPISSEVEDLTSSSKQGISIPSMEASTFQG